MADLLARTGVTTMVVNETNSSVFKIYSTTSDPEIILWNMFQRSSMITGKTPQGKASYRIGEPYQVDPENNKLFRVELTNYSDPKFKIGSVTTIDFLKHDIEVLENSQLQTAPLLTFETLLADLVNKNKVKFTAADFDLENCSLDDGLWSIKASDNSFFFASGTSAKLWNRGGWDRIISWLPSPDLGKLKVISKDKSYSLRNIFDSNLIDINDKVATNKTIDVTKIEPIEYSSNLVTLDRVGKATIIGPETYSFEKLSLSELMESRFLSRITNEIDFDINPIGTGWNYTTRLATLPGGEELTFLYWSNNGNGIAGTLERVEGKKVIRVMNRYGSHICGAIQFPISESWNVLTATLSTSLSRGGTFHGVFVNRILKYTFPANGIYTLNVRHFDDAVTIEINGVSIYVGPGNTIEVGAPYVDSAQFGHAGGNSNDTIISEIYFAKNINNANDERVVLDDGTVYSNLAAINEYFRISLLESDLVDGPVTSEVSKPLTLKVAEQNLTLIGGSEYTIIRAPEMDFVFTNTSLDGFYGVGKTGPGYPHFLNEYVYSDDTNRATKYMGQVSNGQFFADEELMDQIIDDETIVYSMPYSDTNNWFKFELDGDIVFVPQKPVAVGIPFNRLKELNVVNRSGDHLDGTSTTGSGNYKGGVKSGYRSKLVEKDGRLYAVRLIKGLNITGPITPAALTEMDATWTHDSEWNRLFYNLTELTLNPSNGGVVDVKGSQRGEQWESFSSIDMVVDNNGAPGRYTQCPELTLDGSVYMPIYRGCYGVSARGRNAWNLDLPVEQVGFRPMLKLLQPLTEKYNLKAGLSHLGNYVEFDDGSDFDYCRKVSIAYRKVGATAWSSAKPTSDTIHTFLIDSSFSGAEIYFKHTDGLHWYSTNVLTLGELSDIRLIYQLNTSENKTFPSLAGRIASQNNDVKTYNSATPGWFDMWGGGLLNVRLGGFSANWGNGGNTTRYVSGHVCRIIDGVFETRISGRYFSNNGNSKTGLNNSEMQFVISLNGLVRGETPLRISLDYIPTGAMPNATSIYDSGTSKGTKFYEFPERGTRCQLVFDIIGATCQLSINGVVVKTGPLKNEISIGTHYHVVPSTIYVADPLYGIGIENLTIMYLG